MAKLYHGHPFLGSKITGKYGNAGEADPHNIKGIYQRRHGKGKTFLCKMKFYTQTNPRTGPQQANRLKFSAAISEWHALSEEQKNEWRERAKYKKLYGISLFIREKMYG